MSGGAGKHDWGEQPWRGDVRTCAKCGIRRVFVGGLSGRVPGRYAHDYFRGGVRLGRRPGPCEGRAPAPVPAAMDEIRLTDGDVSDIETALRATAEACRSDAAGSSDGRTRAAFEQSASRYEALADRISGAGSIGYRA